MSRQTSDDEQRSLTGVGLEILEMWRRQNPRMVAAMRMSGELMDALVDRQELVTSVIQNLLEKKVPHNRALEVGRSMMGAPIGDDPEPRGQQLPTE